jgi:chromosome segregation ATPase
MTVIPGLVRRAAAEAERHLRAGAGVLVRAGRDLERSAELVRLLPTLMERVLILEQAARDQDAELRAVRTELDSLVRQLNDRLLPRLDERMDDTERDLAAVATSLIRTGRETSGNRTRLEAAERRVADLRTKLAALEQRTGLWRDLQSTVSRFGDDLDAMRARMALRTAEPAAEAAPATVQNITDRPA